jgi:hypothetical protein
MVIFYTESWVASSSLCDPNGPANVFFSLPRPQASPEDSSYTHVVISTEDTTTEGVTNVGVHVTFT